MPSHGSSVPEAERRAPVARVRRAVARAVDRGGVLHPGEGVLVACSGGPDSTVLLDVLARLGPPRGWRLEVAHVDHGLRPGSAADGDHVGELAERYSLPFHRRRVTVSARGSPQDAARRARYGALESIAGEIGAGAIACAHTADDQAETVLMRALTGATPRALGAMAPRYGRLARPLLGVWRVDVERYREALGLPALDDPANRDRRHLRSRVRHDLLPALEAVFPGARRRLVALAEHQRRGAAAALAEPRGPGAVAADPNWGPC